MARVSARAERTFVRLWTHCDDAGRCVYNAMLFKAALYPLHEDVSVADIEADIAELESAGDGLVMRYEVDGKRYLCVRSWAEFQHPQRPSKSKHPEPSARSTPELREDFDTDPRDLPDGVDVGVEMDVGAGEPLERTLAATEPDALLARALERFARTAGPKFDAGETREAIAGARARGYTDAEIDEAMTGCSYPSSGLERALPAKRKHTSPDASTPLVRPDCDECKGEGWISDLDLDAPARSSRRCRKCNPA